ncbi:TVP38/TMEM64 family protein [Belnapia sp. T6]|uniref:TVP38/TMEM64 family membrane protein n=1 Tax=Belnapia mucosa TaxID=2804532 RepID=A0ABS1VBS4_9PROT|nr:TVP38/TMEM64 family protein [Belnapia mucosa]MBL6459103.1 TVP38/TMEM64 family protein [Belnapia mucosa]
MRNDATEQYGREGVRHGCLRFWPVAALLAGLGLALASGLQRYLSLDALVEYREALSQQVAASPVLTALGYVSAYVIAVTFSVPAGPVLTMAGGLLFGRWLGTALALPAATLGACLLFLAVRSALAPAVARRAGPFLDRLKPGLERDGFWYLLSLRLLPIVPYPVGSIAPALVGMPLPAFAVATGLGILPGTLVFAGIGAGLGQVFAYGGRPDASVMLSAPILLPLIGLAALSLVAMWWRRRRSDA